MENIEFKIAGKQNKNIRPSLRKAYVTTSPQLVGERQIKFIFSTPDMDRDYDKISQEGIDLSTYTTAPVVYWNHIHDDMPIAKCVSIGLENGNLTGIVEFVSQDNPEVGQKAEGLYQLCRDGFVSTTSIGFIAQEWKFADEQERYDKDGADIEKCQLVEISLCGIPSNPNCLIQEVGSPETVFELTTAAIDMAVSPAKRLRAARLRRILDSID